MRIAIRVDAAAAIGLGHLKRCLSLAHALRDAGAEVRILAARLDVDVPAIVQAAGFECWQFTPAGNVIGKDSSVATAQDDAHQSAELLRDWMPHWVIVDHYGIDAGWHGKIRQILGTRIAVIDDLANRTLDADLLIDHNFSDNHKVKYAARLKRSMPILGGPRFALLGPSYVNAKPYQFNEQVRSIGIFMGGTDPMDASSLVLEACRVHAGFSGLIEVATTSANPHFSALQAACGRWPDTDVLIDQEELSGFFARHDLQIGAGGGATWERCCIGAPTLALICADNQKVVVPALYRLGAVDTVMPLSAATVGNAVTTLLGDPERRAKLSAASKRLVDGLGARRVALMMLRDMLLVRPARMDDAHLMFEWRNHPATRQSARDDREISWADHEAWIKRTLDNPQRCLLIAEVGHCPVGVIRFDFKGTQAEVSLYLDPALHGLGLGKRMLHAGEASAMTAWPRLEVITAEALEDNLGSQRLFLDAGYAGDYRLFRKTVRTSNAQYRTN